MSRLSSLAVRNVARNKRRSAVTLLALLIGVTVLVTLRGFMNGFLEMSVRSVVQGKTGALQVHRQGYLSSIEGAPLKLDMPHSPELMEKIRAVPGVTAVTGRIQFGGLVSNGLNQTMFVGRALDLATERQVCPRSGQDVLPGGADLAPEDHDMAVLGGELAASFNAVTPQEKAGTGSGTDLVTLSSSSPRGRANSLTVTVKGKSSSGLAFENKRVLTVPLALAQDLLDMRGRVTEYAVAVADLDELDRVAAALAVALGPEYEVSTWKELQPFLRDLITRQRVVFGIISVVLLVIVLAGIVNTMLMSVFERVREIGTMLAFGVRRRQVLGLFLLEAATLGAVGGAGGAALGWGLVRWLGRVGIHLPVSGSAADDIVRPVISTGAVGAAVLGAALAALAAAAYPAWRASRMNPVDALRSL